MVYLSVGYDMDTWTSSVLECECQIYNSDMRIWYRFDYSAKKKYGYQKWFRCEIKINK